MSEELTIIAELRASAGHEAEVRAALLACTASSREDAGCISYAPHVDANDPLRFVFVERWASAQALAAHERTPHFQALVARLEGLLDGALKVSRLQALA